MAEYSEVDVLGQALVAFGQGTGAVWIHRDTVAEIRTRYEPRLKEALKNWKEDAPHALERVRATGRLAALLATQAGLTAVTPGNFTEAATMVEAASVDDSGLRTRICA